MKEKGEEKAEGKGRNRLAEMERKSGREKEYISGKRRKRM